MAIKLELGKSNDEKQLDALIEDLKKITRSEALDNLIAELEAISEGKRSPSIKPLSLYVETLKIIREHTVGSRDYAAALKVASMVYDDLFIRGEETPDFENVEAVYKRIISDSGLKNSSFFNYELFASFTDKANFVSLVDSVKKCAMSKQIFDKLCTYGICAREYIIDDKGYLTNLLKVKNKLELSSPETMDFVLEEELTFLRRANGIYDIDPIKLAAVERNLNAANAIMEGSRDLLNNLDSKQKNIELIVDQFEQRAKDIKTITEASLDDRAATARNRVDIALKEFIAGQQKTIIMDKELALKQLYSDAEMELQKYRAMAKTITANTSAEIAGLAKSADDVIRKLSDATKNDETINEFLTKARLDEAILNKIENLSMLNDASIERMMSDKNTIRRAPEEVTVNEDASVGALKIPAYRHSREERPIEKVNPLLDMSIPFSDRITSVKAQKAMRMGKGELFHEKFDDVITAVMEDVNPYLIGPSGCGKTHMIMQIGQILGLECVDIGYINEEYDILGYVTATGDYNESNFYRLYKYGGIAFCDELDNGNGKATVKLNSFLTNKIDSSYCFPGGERVQRHPNFRVVAAGNTDGSGADSIYNTREKIEESVQQRMIPIYVDYDNRVEKAILKDYPEWYDFCCAFRHATDRWSEVCGIPAPGILTTRDASRIRN
nr:AAA family ATPase [Lachnospiraceae bacterium]